MGFELWPLSLLCKCSFSGSHLPARYYFWWSNCIYLSSWLRFVKQPCCNLLLLCDEFQFSQLESKQPLRGLSFPNQMSSPPPRPPPPYALIWQDFNWGNRQDMCHPFQRGGMFYGCILEGQCLVLEDEVWAETRASDSGTEIRRSNPDGDGIRRNGWTIVDRRAGEWSVEVLTQEQGSRSDDSVNRAKKRQDNGRKVSRKGISLLKDAVVASFAPRKGACVT